jgi:Raf kinase inhibitor-like YbhB/YbcL family protein
MGLAHNAATAFGRALRPVRAGEEKIAWRKLRLEGPGVLTLRSPAFANGHALPISATIDGEGSPPPISFRGVPMAARTLVLVCEDPDAPFPKPFVHWLAYGISATSAGTLVGAAPREGKNSNMKLGFAPAAPPAGHGPHHYHFQLFALDQELALAPGEGRNAVLDAMRGHVIAWGELIGTYERR